MAVSTHGEFCPGAVRVQEWLTGKYRARLLLEGDRDDGEKTEDLTAAFRREFRASLLVASCKGLADMLLAAGMPVAGTRAPGWSRASGGRALAPPTPPPPPPPRPPLPDSHDPLLVRDSETVELCDDEDECSTASSSEDNDGEDVAPWALRRSARLEAQTQARPRAAARTPPLLTPPSSSGAACCAVSDADSGADGDEDSDADGSPLSIVVCDGFPVVS